MPELYVDARPLPRVDLGPDAHICGRHPVWVRDEVPEDRWANAALDIFHGSVAVDCLDLFSFEVRNQEGELLTESDEVDAYSLIDAGSVG